MATDLPVILIYTRKLSPRVTYTFRQVLGNILGCTVKFTDKVEEFISHKEAKFSYCKQQMGNELFVKSAGFLHQQGISKLELTVKRWDDVPCFFKVGEESAVPFDIFSASFYMLSRYEEYSHREKDQKSPYQAEESLAYKNRFLHRPIVDLWAYKFKEILKRRFPDIHFPTRRFKTRNVLEVAEAYKYRKKGITRNFGGIVADLVHFRFWSIFGRIRTLSFLSKDPYDIYDELIRFSKQHRLKWEFMFQLSDYSMHNKNLGYNKVSYHTLIKSMGDYGKIGLLLGYEALFDFEELKKEKKHWENIVYRELEMVMSNDYGLNLPQLYNNFDTLEINQDYSMGFVDKIGFRAGTCSPFLFYDLKLERISPLTVIPPAFNSAAFTLSSFFEVKTILERLKKDVEKVGGQLYMIFHNYDFREGEGGRKFYQLLEKMNEK